MAGPHEINSCKSRLLPDKSSCKSNITIALFIIPAFVIQRHQTKSCVVDTLRKFVDCENKHHASS